ncbi:MAG: restriction endonuclease subunit S [Streptococcus pyogenes]|nr:MAG: restriction endonuclease subunit S [Streptococcus pyogenes]
MQEQIRAYLEDGRPKIRLAEVTECFKGKAIAKQLPPGDFRLINLSDMGNEGIHYESLRSFQQDRRQLLRYILEDGDVLIASKGTVKKVCVFHQQDHETLASSNITVLRPISHVRGYYIKFFLDSMIGQAFLEAADHGKNVMNLSTKELLEIPIPELPLVKQDYLISRYLRGYNDYQRKMLRAKQEWDHLRAEIERHLN